MNNYIAYYRVSTAKQGQSGLGLDAQRAMVAKYASTGTIVAEYSEVESGKRSDRPVLAEAIEHCKRTGCVLLVAKLDRLTRETLYMILQLQDAVRRGELQQFVCCDMPAADEATIQFLAVVATREVRQISERTKAALQQLKLRGVTLGNPANLTNVSRANSIATRKQQAANNEHWKRAAAYAQMRRDANATYRQIADELNSNGYLTRNGKSFAAATVQRLVNRSGRIESTDPIQSIA
jgi:DNA invertase Pin-like site-specific DNA recombinase